MMDDDLNAYYQQQLHQQVQLLIERLHSLASNIDQRYRHLDRTGNRIAIVEYVQHEIAQGFANLGIDNLITLGLELVREETSPPPSEPASEC